MVISSEICRLGTWAILVRLVYAYVIHRAEQVHLYMYSVYASTFFLKKSTLTWYSSNIVAYYATETKVSRCCRRMGGIVLLKMMGWTPLALNTQLHGPGQVQPFLFCRYKQSKKPHKTHAWNQAVKNVSYSETTWSLGAFYNLESSGCCLGTLLWYY